MLAKKAVLDAALRKNAPVTFVRASHATGGFHDPRLPIGNREWVCYGRNSKPNYNDRLDFPIPAVRFMEIKGDLIVSNRSSCPEEEIRKFYDPETPCLKPSFIFPSFECVLLCGSYVIPLVIGLREKEKGDWKNLTIEEKKKLYRASFRQTLVEARASTGEWKGIFGWSLFFASLGICFWAYEKRYLLRPLPITFSPERRAAQLRKTIDIKAGALTGVSSYWDYEKDDWKK